MDMTIAAAQQYESDEVAFLLILRKNVFTGCDTVSSFAGRGKKAFDIWKSFNEVTAVFNSLSTNQSRFNDDFMCILETYNLCFCMTEPAQKLQSTPPESISSVAKPGQSKP